MKIRIVCPSRIPSTPGLTAPSNPAEDFYRNDYPDEDPDQDSDDSDDSDALIGTYHGTNRLVGCCIIHLADSEGEFEEEGEEERDLNAFLAWRGQW